MPKARKICAAALMIAAMFFCFQLAPAHAQISISGSASSPDLGVEYPRESGLTNVDVRITIARIIRVLMSLLGIVFVILVIYGGWLWMTAGGNSERSGKGRGWIYAGIIGLAIIMSAFAISTFVINNLVVATAPSASNLYP